MSDIYDVIQAFADGEPVEPAELDAALADPEGRAHLIDIVVLRKLVKASTTVVSMPAGARTVRHPLRWLAAAAAVVLAASVGSYLIGARSTSSPVQNTSTAATEPRQEAIVPAVPAPAPTVVIRFQPGVDWTERGGK
jgi:hypothetical protein